MFSIFKKKKNPKFVGSEFPLHFKSNQSAFEMACKYLDNEIVTGKYLPAMVIDAKSEFGAEDSIRVQDDGSQLAMIRLPHASRLIIIPAVTASSIGPLLLPGDLVAWQALQYSKELAKSLGSKEAGWAGLIFAKLKPIYNSGSWMIGERFEREVV